MYKTRTQSVSYLRDQIVTAVNTITNYEELSLINSFIRREEIKRVAARALESKIKRFHVNLSDRISKSLGDLDYSFEEKYRLLETIQNNDGIWNADSIIRYRQGNIKPLINPHLDLNPMLVKDFGAAVILDFTGNLGFNSATIGAGEFFIAFTGKNADFASKGDLVIQNKLVEVKASVRGKKGNFAGGRLAANTGYRANTSVRSQLTEYLIAKGVPKNILDQYGWSAEYSSAYLGGLNLNQAGLRNMSGLCTQYLGKKKTRDFLAELITCMYYDTDLYTLDGILGLVESDGSFDMMSMQVELIKLAHVYYAAKEEHDAILYFNTDNWNYVLVDDPDQYDQLIRTSKLRLTSGLDFNEDRAKGSAQIIVT